MRQNEFIETHSAFWERLEARLNAPRNKRLSDSERKTLPADYRKLCHHLSLAKLRNYSPALQERLNQLALKNHQLFYEANSRMLSRMGAFFAVDFPQCVRRNKYYVLVSALLFFGPLLGLMIGVINDPSLAYTVIDANMAENFKQMYSQTAEEKDRTALEDVRMFGMYIWNNIGIALRTFSSGLLFGVGAIFILIFNGISIGAVAGFLTSLGYAENFWSFVAGHGSFELTAIVLAGASGMKLGFSILIPGRLSRAEALKQAGNDLIPMIYGFTLMLLIAAAIEAFWSPSAGISSQVKYWVGGTLWLLVIAYFLFAGRGVNKE